MSKIFKKSDFVDIVHCFSGKTENKYRYLGYVYNLFKKGTIPYLLIEDYIKYVDKSAKPKWCPRWFLNLLQLYGNDNSIVRVRFWWLYKLHNYLTKGYRFHDIKEKYGTLRIYGSFNENMYRRLDEICKIIDNNYLKEY